MSSGKGGRSGAKLPISGSTNLSKGKTVPQVSDRWVGRVADGVSAVSLNSEQNGSWEEVGKKPRNRSFVNVGSQNPSVKVSGHPWTGSKGPSNAWSGTKQPVSAWVGQGSANAFTAPVGDCRRPTGRVWNQSSSKEYETKYDQPAEFPPLKRGRQRRRNMSQAAKVGNVSASNPGNATDKKEERKHVDEVDLDTEDIYDSDESDLDESEMSHEILKEILKGFFKTLDEMKAEVINEPNRKWHCPACYGGPGAIAWYCGLHALINHAKTKGKRRTKAHRVLARLLDWELRKKGTSIVPARETFVMWKGLSGSNVKDRKIVWPPMVVIMNTQLERDDDYGKWVGMGNNEILEYFRDYEAVKARHSYGPQGHRGMSVLIFEASAVGFFKAYRLCKHFEDEGTDRDAWNHHQAQQFRPGEQRLLYGFMAEKEDIDMLNRHCKGRSVVKFEMRSYEEMVDSFRQMNEDNHFLNWYKNLAVKEKNFAKELEDSFGFVREKLLRTQEENRIVRERTKMHQEQLKEV